MELRSYWRILKRRWLYLVVPTLIVLAIGLITYSRPAPLYNAGVRFIVGQAPIGSASLTDEQRLANWKTSEYVVNALADWVRGGQFADLVSDGLAQQGITVAPQAIVAGTSADSTRSMMVLSISYGDPVVLEQIMHEAGRVLIEQNDLGLPQLGGEPAQLVQLDEPIVNRLSASIVRQLDLPLRIVLALFAGVGLALLVEYLDPTIRDRQEVEGMGLSVIGAIPGSGKGWGDIFPGRRDQ
jgi:capsular polysaccharide biosynthesis protein